MARLIIASVLVLLVACLGCVAYMSSPLCYGNEVDFSVDADDGVFSDDGQTVYLLAFVRYYRKPVGLLCSFPVGNIRVVRQGPLVLAHDLASGTTEHLAANGPPEGFTLEPSSSSVQFQRRAPGRLYATVAGQRPSQPNRVQDVLRYEIDTRAARVRSLSSAEWVHQTASAEGTGASPRSDPQGRRVAYVQSETGPKGFVLRLREPSESSRVLVTEREITRYIFPPAQ